MLRTVIWFTYFWLFQLFSLIPLLIYLLLGLFKQRGWQEKLLYRLTRSWARQLVALAGGQVEVSGLENLPPKQGVLFVANHQGAFDIPLLLGYIPGVKGFVSKKQNSRLPIVGIWMKLLRCVILDRENLRQSAKAMVMGVRFLKEGWSLVIFPEGTRSKSGVMNRFKDGSFKLATRSGATIVPLTIDGSYRLLEGNHGRVQPGKIRLHIHPLIDLGRLSMSETSKLAETIQNMIATKLSV
jgi:1-acyl-sn-glycerol-3-phosphate acyltransferase